MPPEASSEPIRKKGWDALVDLTGEIPLAGPVIKFVLRLLDWQTGSFLFAGLLAGFALALFLVYSNLIPYVKTGESLRQWGARGLSVHAKPQIVGFSVLPPPSDWRYAFQNILVEEGQSLKQGDPNYHYAPITLEATLAPTTEFVLVLRPSPGFKLSGYAFRETSVSPEKQLLEYLPVAFQGESLSIKVPR